MNNLPRSRAEARARNATRYFTGVPCSHGHVAERFLTGTCVLCQRRAVREYGARNPEAMRKYGRDYYRRHRDRVRANGLKSKRKAMGIPDATRPRPPNCELCGRELIDGRVHLDHDHATGKFRGWLCNRCNLALGHLGDCAAGLKRAVAYLERTTCG